MPAEKLIEDGAGWETLAREVQFSTPHLSVAKVKVRTPSRPEAREWTVAHRKAAVVIAPITEEGKFILILEERIPIRAAIWGMPAGQIDEAGELNAAAIEGVARRELREETGYELAPGGELISLGEFFSSPGFADEHAYLFLARPVRKHADSHAHEGAEAILECREFSPDVLRAMIAGGEIRDANTLSIWARMVARAIFFPDQFARGTPNE